MDSLALRQGNETDFLHLSKPFRWPRLVCAAEPLRVGQVRLKSGIQGETD